MGPCFPGKSSDACIWKNAVQCRILFNRALSGNCKIFFWSHHSYACPNQQISVSRHKRPIMPCFECLGIDLTNCSQYVFFSPFHLALLLTIIAQGPSLHVSILPKHGMFGVPRPQLLLASLVCVCSASQ